MSKPWLLLDVDDVLNWIDRKGHKPPYCGCAEHRQWISRSIEASNGIRYRVTMNPDFGPLLRSLAKEHDAQLAWYTSWGEDANSVIGRHFGFDELPVVPFPPWPGRTTSHPGYGVWKGTCLVQWARMTGHPFGLFDNEPEIPGVVEAARLTQPHLVVQVDPRTGLTEENIETAGTWLASLPA